NPPALRSQPRHETYTRTGCGKGQLIGRASPLFSSIRCLQSPQSGVHTKSSAAKSHNAAVDLFNKSNDFRKMVDPRTPVGGSNTGGPIADTDIMPILRAYWGRD